MIEVILIIIGVLLGSFLIAAVCGKGTAILRDWILVFIFAIIILRLIGLMGVKGQMDTLEESHAAQLQIISELWRTMDGVATITDSLGRRIGEVETIMGKTQEIPDRDRTQEFAIFNILVDHCDEVLTVDKIEQIGREIAKEMREGPCSWAFAIEEAP